MIPAEVAVVGLAVLLPMAWIAGRSADRRATKRDAARLIAETEARLRHPSSRGRL